jgi:hypothetical protein
MAPVKLLFLSESLWRLVSMLPSSTGIRPWSWLLLSLKEIKLKQKLRLTGIIQEEL